MLSLGSRGHTVASCDLCKNGAKNGIRWKEISLSLWSLSLPYSVSPPRPTREMVDKETLFFLYIFFFTSCFGGSLGVPQMNMLPMVLLFSPKWKGFQGLPSLSEFNDSNIISINIMIAIVTVDVITGIVIIL